MDTGIFDIKRRTRICLAAVSVSLIGGVALAHSTGSAKGATSLLPDSRAYEQVSPGSKEGADIEPAPATAAIDGSRLFFVSRGSFAGQPTTLAAEASPYLSTRGPQGWTTEGIALPNGQLTFGGEGYQGFTPSLAKGIISWQEDTRFGPYDPSAQPGVNQYIRDSETGSFQLASGTLSAMNRDEGFLWGSSTFDVLGLESAHKLTDDSPCPVVEEEDCVYESVHGAVRLASLLPNEEPVTGTIGGFKEGNKRCNFEHAMSDDGSRLFFSAYSGDHQLYARDHGTSTSLVSGSERALPGGVTGGPVKYQSAEAAQGDKVLFTTKNALVDADIDATNDLYMYDFTKPVGGRLMLVSEDHNPDLPEGASVNGGPDGCAGFVGASEDLQRVYFVADNQIVAGAPADPGPKLYLWDDSGPSPELIYIGALGAKDSRVWAAPAVVVRNGGIPRQARWSRDGRYLAFIATASLTGFPTEDESELYRYDAVLQTLECLTCITDVLPAKGQVHFQSPEALIQPVNRLPRNVSDTGQVFFQTLRGLIPQDSNGKEDVYEYDGQLHLISKGASDSGSYFLDATPDGSDVFFATRDRLVGWDTDGNLDAYDARVEGGFPEPGFVTPACEGEACLAPASAPNDPSPGSSSFIGAGNPQSSGVRPCPKGKVRKHGKCRKKKRGNKQHHRPKGKASNRRHD